MLETIFFPNNAIHDGGVILVGDRIAFAACIFPLTQRQDLAKSLGTRHRAAIGLTEETDAVVVVGVAGLLHGGDGALLRFSPMNQLPARLGLHRHGAAAAVDDLRAARPGLIDAPKFAAPE